MAAAHNAGNWYELSPRSCTNSKSRGRVLCADDGLRLVGEPAGYAEISEAVQAVPGVVAHGLFVNIATSAVVATPDGPRMIQKVSASALVRGV